VNFLSIWKVSALSASVHGGEVHLSRGRGGVDKSKFKPIETTIVRQRALPVDSIDYWNCEESNVERSDELAFV
jgi:hypothetical protein